MRAHDVDAKPLYSIKKKRMNQLFQNITIENYNELIQSFERSREIFWDPEKKKLFHPGEYGEYREDILKRFLGLYIPEMFGIGSGFIITSSGEISSQCDIIIYDIKNTPRIQNFENQRFFPIETVLGVGEVKSTINSINKLNDYLKKLSKIKELRLTVNDPKPYRRGDFKSPYNPSHLFPDNIFTFLLCYEFNFDLNLENLDYADINHKLWHNMVLSLKDGLISYQAEETKNLYFPFRGENKLDFWYLPNDELDLPTPIIVFLSGLSFFVNNNTLLEIHMENYLTDKLAEKIE